MSYYDPDDTFTAYPDRAPIDQGTDDHACYVPCDYCGRGEFPVLSTSEPTTPPLPRFYRSVLTYSLLGILSRDDGLYSQDHDAIRRELAYREYVAECRAESCEPHDFHMWQVHQMPTGPLG